MRGGVHEPSSRQPVDAALDTPTAAARARRNRHRARPAREFHEITHHHRLPYRGDQLKSAIASTRRLGKAPAPEPRGNPKLETRNPNQIRNPKSEARNSSVQHHTARSSSGRSHPALSPRRGSSIRRRRLANRELRNSLAPAALATATNVQTRASATIPSPSGEGKGEGP